MKKMMEISKKKKTSQTQTTVWGYQREKVGGGEKGKVGINSDRIDLTLGGKHTIYRCYYRTVHLKHIIVLTNVTPINSTKKIFK